MPLTHAARPQICSRLIAMTAAVIAAAYCVRADAAVIALDAVARGWYTDEGIANFAHQRETQEMKFATISRGTSLRPIKSHVR